MLCRFRGFQSKGGDVKANINYRLELTCDARKPIARGWFGVDDKGNRNER